MDKTVTVQLTVAEIRLVRAAMSDRFLRAEKDGEATLWRSAAAKLDGYTPHKQIRIVRIEGGSVYGHYVSGCLDCVACESDAHWFCSVDASKVEAGETYDIDADHNVIRMVR